MSKFKVGDRVRFCSKINPDKRSFKNGDIFTIQALSNFTIQALSNFTYSVNRTQAYSVGEVYVVFENELTLITNSEIHITTDGKTTHAVLKENGKVTKRAKADCSPADDFDFRIGATLAFNRLLGSEVALKSVVREVKRPAKVGEWVKIVRANQEPYDVGDIVMVEEVLPTDGIYFKSKNGKTNNNDYSYKGLNYAIVDEYVVLENYQPSKQIPAEF